MPLQFTRSWSDPDLESYRDSVASFIDSEMVPADEQARKRGDVGHEIWRQAGELGFLCADIPEEYGGAGGDFRHEAVFYEEMSRRGLTGMSTSVHAIVAHYFLNHGTEAQKRAWLPRLQARLDEGKEDDTLVVVGAMHLLGPDGLVEMLRAKGYTVERQ